MFRLKSVERVSQQVVAGVLYKIYAKYTTPTNEEINCDLEIWSRAWLNKKDVTFVCNENTYKFKINNPSGNVSRRKRETLVGGPREISVDDEEVTNIVNSALSSIAGQADGKTYR